MRLLPEAHLPASAVAGAATVRPHGGQFGTSGAPRQSGIMGPMKGALTVDEPQGERWDLALDLLSNGPDLIAIGPEVLLHRETAGPDPDGLIHIGVVANAPRERAQSEVDAARGFVAHLAYKDERFGSLLRQFGVTWEYVEDGGTLTVTLAKVSDAGELVWPDS